MLEAEAIGVLVRQVARLSGVERVLVVRAEPGGSITDLVSVLPPRDDHALGPRWMPGSRWMPGPRWTPGPQGVVGRALASGDVEICDDLTAVPGASSRYGDVIRSCAVVPITTSGDLWGAVELCSAQSPFPRPGLDVSIGLAEIAALAIGHARRCGDLQASRLRLVNELDNAAIRVERELHGGVQQRLTTAGMDLRLAQAELPADDPAHEVLTSIDEQLAAMTADVRELSRRVFPAILTDGGVGPAMRSLARRAALPVELEVARLGRYPAVLEATVYQVVSNVVEHAARARAGHVSVQITDLDGRLRLVVTEHGTSRAENGEILRPVLRDRVDALGGSLDVRVTSEGSTVVAAFGVSVGFGD